MSNQTENRGPSVGTWGVGGLLIVLGALLLVGQLLGIRPGRFLWPFFVIVPGVVVFAIALTAEPQAGEVLAIVGGIVTMVGALLLYQNTTGHWTSWAYAWALVGPTAAGLAQMIYGSLKGPDTLVATGRHVATIGIAIFLVGAVFFELVIGISGFGLGRFGWPVLLIGAGAFFLLRAVLTGQKRE